jgi:hypothetical protein
MQGQAIRMAGRAARLALAGAVAVLAFGASGGAVRADDPPSCASSAEAAYSLALTSLTGPRGAEATLAVTPAAGCAQVETLKKLQLKTFTSAGKVDDVRNLTDVPAPHGVATVELGQLDQGRRVEAQVLVQADDPSRTYVLHGEATARLRPDLVVAAVHAPAQTLTTRPVDVEADVKEVNGDTGATATVSLVWGPTVFGSKQVTIPAGESLSVSFDRVALETPVPVELSVVVSDVAPEETDETNDAAKTTVDVTELELQRSRLVLGSLGGFGAQMNGHVYAGVLPAPAASLPDLEAKVKALEPQLVRIFYSEAQEAIPARMESFVKTVELAQESGATINITYQSTARAKVNSDLFMGQFAAVLDDLVRADGLTNVRWVTIQNEPNRTQITLDEYNRLYRALNAQLVARGLRSQIGLMGGDLVEFGDLPNLPYPDHHTWWNYMASNMNDILDAYSVHIYWNYWDIKRMEFRLEDVRRIVDALPADARKPVCVTEFGVRGIQNFPGKPAFQPGYWADGTQMSRTNIEAFQMLWFNVLAAQLGYSGSVKWDAYWGKYDSSYNANWWLIGPPEEGWPLMPAYHALRLLLQTTDNGWQVIGVDPWNDDDWKLDANDDPQDQPEKEVAAFGGPDGLLTLFGLDSHGGALNAASADKPSYSVGGLPPLSEFHLLLWNAVGDGVDSIAGTVMTNAAGVARFEVPLQAAFALTTVPIS